MFTKAIDLLKTLENIDENSTNLIVGGAVRDYIMGGIPADIDIATNIPIDVLEKHFESHDIGANKDFGILVIKYQDEIFEIANFRRDSSYSDGRHPDSIDLVSSYQEDSNRRDFTINAMGLDSDLNVIDYHNGIQHIKNKVLTTVGNPIDRFREDYLRMLRAIRFASRLDFKMDSKTKEAISLHSMKILDISKERIFKEIEKMADQPGYKFADSIIMMNECNLLRFIFPEIFHMEGFRHSEIHHPEGGVYEHTIAALRQNTVADKYVNLAILFHDIGKIKTYSYDFEKGIHRYKGHDKESVNMIENIYYRLKMDNKTKNICQFCAENHMKFHNLHEMKKSNVFALMEHEYWNYLVQVCKCDEKSRGESFDYEWIQKEQFIETLNNKFSVRNHIKKIRSVVTGNLVMSLRDDIKPSKELGNIIKDTVDWILDNDKCVDNDIEEIKQFVKDYKNG